MKRSAPWVALGFLLPATAAAQSPEDRATQACLLLRPAADCVLEGAAPFSAPGDTLSLTMLRPAMSAKARERAAPTYLSGEIGAEVVLDVRRQLVSIPVMWTPAEWLTIGAVIPVVHQSLPTEGTFGVGDVAAVLGTNLLVGPLLVRGVGALKLPTGSPEDGNGSGRFEGLGFADVWWAPGAFAAVASVGYRHKGKEGDGDLLQASLGARYGVEIGPVELILEGRLFAHRVLDPEAKNTLHGVISLVPRFWTFGFGYVGLYLPIVTGEDLLQTVVMSAGVDVPFGRAPEAPPAVSTSTTAREEPVGH